jgi:citrate lyase beta subunit
LEDQVTSHTKKNLITITKERCIRINAIGSGLEQDDLEKCVGPAAQAGFLDAIVIPKVESSQDIQTISKYS